MDWEVAISKRKGDIKSTQVQAMAEHTLQKTTRGGAGCGTYTCSRVLHEKMVELTSIVIDAHQTSNTDQVRTHFVNFELSTATSILAMVNAKGCEEDLRETEGLVCNLSTFTSIPTPTY